MGPNKGKNYERILTRILPGSCREIKNKNKQYSKFTSMVTGHGNVRYLHDLK